MINTAIIGYGLSGRVFHAPFIHTNENFDLKKVVQRKGDLAREHYPNVEIVRDYKALLHDPDLELIVIATPNEFHFQMAKDCLDAGKHIVIEKPFMPTSGEAERIISLAEQKKLNVFVYQNRRFDGDFMTLQQLIDSRWLGDINYFEAHFDRFSPKRTRAAWRDEVLPGSGILFDLGSHLIDQVLCLFGKPLALRAKVEKQRPGSMVDDFFEISMIYPEMTAVVTAGMLVRDHELRYRLEGSSGKYTKFGIDVQESHLKKGLMPVGDDWGEEPASDWGHLSLSKDGLVMEGTLKTKAGNYMDFYDNVYEVMRAKGEMVIKPREAMEVIRMIERAFESHDLNKEIEC
ncbi:MAG: Gfo/Idh/MocA family oxidoreductase [bacterium]|jgi:scyllo-inositol 2-dehydrogenase (NADP+)